MLTTTVQEISSARSFPLAGCPRISAITIQTTLDANNKNICFIKLFNQHLFVGLALFPTSSRSYMNVFHIDPPHPQHDG